MITNFKQAICSPEVSDKELDSEINSEVKISKGGSRSHKKKRNPTSFAFELAPQNAGNTKQASLSLILARICRDFCGSAKTHFPLL